MIGLWTFLAIAVVASSVAQMFKYYQKNNPASSIDEELLKIMKSEIEGLKGRVANLEAIASADLREKSKTIWSDYQVDEEGEGEKGSKGTSKRREGLR